MTWSIDWIESVWNGEQRRTHTTTDVWWMVELFISWSCGCVWLNEIFCSWPLQYSNTHLRSLCSCWFSRNLATRWTYTHTNTHTQARMHARAYTQCHPPSLYTDIHTQMQKNSTERKRCTTISIAFRCKMMCENWSHRIPILKSTNGMLAIRHVHTHPHTHQHTHTCTRNMYIYIYTRPHNLLGLHTCARLCAYWAIQT